MCKKCGNEGRFCGTDTPCKNTNLSSSVVMSDSIQVPEFIYLQLDGDGGSDYFEEEATWAAERIYKSDIKYKRYNE